MYQYSRTTTTKAIAAQNEETNHLWALWATRAFLAVSVTISVMGAWGKGAIPGVLFTVVMGALLGKALAYYEARNWRLFAQTVIMGAIFALVEANLNHIGLEAMNLTYDIAPADLLVPACIGLSLVNIFGTDTYTSTPTIKAPRKKEVDLVLRSTRIASEPDERHDIRMTNWENQIGNGLGGGNPRPTPEGISETLAAVAAKINGAHVSN